MPIFEAFVLGLVQGFTEFLPISSSGHLLIVPWLFGWEELDESSKKRQAHISWESGGRKGEHQLEEGFSVLIGTDDLCDIRVPKGPKHHLLFIRTSAGYEVRNLAMFGKMTVGGRATKKARLNDGDVVEMGGVKLTFADEL